MIELKNIRTPAIAYIKDKLSQGHTLAQELQKLPLDAGCVFVDLYPEDANKAIQLTDFYSGGIRSHRGNQEELEELIQGYLQSKKNRYALFQDYNTKPQDPYLQSRKVPYVLYGEEIYDFQSSYSHDLESIKECLHNTDALWIKISLLCTFPPGFSISPYQQISTGDLFTIVGGTTHILVGAYDMEANLIWVHPSFNHSAL